MSGISFFKDIMRPNSPRERFIPFKDTNFWGVRTQPAMETFLYISKSEESISQKIYVFNLHICQLVSAKYIY